MKRIIPIVVVFTMILSLCACAGESAPSTEPSTEPIQSEAVSPSPSTAPSPSPSISPSPSGDPEPAIIVRDELRTEDVGGGRMELCYPQIDCPSASEFAGEFNKFINQIVESYVEDFSLMVADEASGLSDLSGWYANLAYDTMWLSDEAVSVRLYFDTFTGGAHSLRSFQSYTAVIGEGFVTIPQLFGEDAMAAILDEISAQIPEREFLYDDAETIARESFQENMAALSPAGLSVVYGAYTLAPYVAGEQDFLIPYDKISDSLPNWLKDE